MTIHLLDDLTINQMAAGEVIENTSSVIKELLENSIDANASSIEVEIQSGGRSYIRVSDNGDGILHEEVPKAIVRHATSKLTTFSDLENLGTLGFRGEALASIASISKLSITTATTSPSSSTPNGTFFVAEGGRTVTHVLVFREKGTTIEVKELFFNTPVRKTFQRSSIFDTQDIVKTMTHIALGFPQIAFRLIADKKTVLDLYATDLKERSAALLGKNFVQKSTEIAFEKKGLFVKGLIGDPVDHRHNRMGQYLLLNRRSIFSPMVSASVREGYGHALPEGRHPQFVIHLDIDPKEIDVNVHPRKTEARFRTKGTLSHSLTLAVQGALFKQTHTVAQPTLSKMSWSAEEVPLLPPVFERPFHETLFAPLPKIIETLPGYVIVDPKSVPKLFDPVHTGLGIIDTAAAFLFLFKLQDLPEYIPIPLLIPHEMEATSEMLLALEEVAPFLKRLGIEATPFSHKSILIHSHPSGLSESDLFDLVREVFLNWRENLPIKRIEKVSQLLGKKRLSSQEAIFLIQKLEGHPPQKSVAKWITSELLDKWLKK